jgi:hypothetical protein
MKFIAKNNNFRLFRYTFIYFYKKYYELSEYKEFIFYL